MYGVFVCTLLTPLTLTLATPQVPELKPVTEAAKGFIYRTLEHEGETYAYSVYVPPDYTPEQPWPVILFLHGSGERGADGFHQTAVGLPSVIRNDYPLVPAIVVMPQCRPNMSWLGPMTKVALRCLEQTSHEYHLDAQRIYLTGLSMGGHGAWHIGAMLPGRFAAIVPICGFAELTESTGLAKQLAAKLKDTPIWCFHGAADESVPVDKTREMVAALHAVDGNVKYTEYEGGGHAIWDRAYASRELWRWIFAQRLDRVTHPQP